jgi:hypothetical protein
LSSTSAFPWVQLYFYINVVLMSENISIFWRLQELSVRSPLTDDRCNQLQKLLPSPANWQAIHANLQNWIPTSLWKMQTLDSTCMLSSHIGSLSGGIWFIAMLKYWPREHLRRPSWRASRQGLRQRLRPASARGGRGQAAGKGCGSASRQGLWRRLRHASARGGRGQAAGKGCGSASRQGRRRRKQQATPATANGMRMGPLF